jgi:N-acetylornithine carbamoyltransferase
MNAAAKKDLLWLEDWSSDEIESVLQLARRIKRGEVSGGLERRILSLIFLQPDQHTRISFESAMFLHGGRAVTLEAGDDPEELLIDTAQLLARTSDAVGLRAFQVGGEWTAARQDGVLRSFAQNCAKPVINLGSARRNPCQALADSLTLQEQLGRVEGKRFVLTWAWNPRALPTAIPVSAALAAARLGMEIVIARPEGYELDPEDTALIRRTAQQAGGEFVHINDDPDDALVGADAVYVASWGSVKLYGKPDEERELRAGLRDWRLTPSRLRSSRGGKGTVLHAFPFLRNIEIDEKVLEGGSSAVIDQAENRLPVHRAVLLHLIRDAAGGPS